MVLVQETAPVPFLPLPLTDGSLSSHCPAEPGLVPPGSEERLLALTDCGYQRVLSHITGVPILHHGDVAVTLEDGGLAAGSGKGRHG